MHRDSFDKGQGENLTLPLALLAAGCFFFLLPSLLQWLL
jgi:hypothetical protein